MTSPAPLSLIDADILLVARIWSEPDLCGEKPMPYRLLIAPLFVLLILASPVPAKAQLDQATAEIIALEIRNLSTSVDRLTRLVYEQAQKDSQEVILRKLDIAVAYLNFRSRRIEMLERDLQTSRSTKSRMEDIIRQWEQRLEELEQEASNTSGQAGEAQLSRDEASQQLKMLRSRLARIDSDILDFENNASELKSQLDSVESFVERHLEL